MDIALDIMLALARGLKAEFPEYDIQHNTITNIISVKETEVNGLEIYIKNDRILVATPNATANLNINRRFYRQVYQRVLDTTKELHHPNTDVLADVVRIIKREIHKTSHRSYD